LICKEREASETWAQLEMIPLPKKETRTLVQCEGKAILGMKAWHELGAKHRNQFPRTAIFKIATQDKESFNIGL